MVSVGRKKKAATTSAGEKKLLWIFAAMEKKYENQGVMKLSRLQAIMVSTTWGRFLEELWTS